MWLAIIWTNENDGLIHGHRYASIDLSELSLKKLTCWERIATKNSVWTSYASYIEFRHSYCRHCILKYVFWGFNWQMILETERVDIKHGKFQSITNSNGNIIPTYLTE